MIKLYEEIGRGVKERRIWTRLAKMSIDTQYKQNTLGPVWISVNSGVLIVAFAMVYSQILSTDFSNHIVYVASGLVCWYFISATILKGCSAFIVSRQLILQLPMPISTHIFRLVYQELLIFIYNFAVLVIVCILFKRDVGFELLLIVPAFFLIATCLFFTAFLLAIIATRYRDVTSTAQAVITPLMFLTPIIWSADSLAGRPVFVTMNPFFHLIEIWRSPIVGTAFPWQSWVFVLVVTFVLATICAALFGRYEKRIVFWL